jgi:anti-sigma factor RsiW
MRHLTQDELVLYYYREQGGVDRRQAEEHLHSCELCRRELASLTESLEAIASLPVPARGENYGSEVWTRIRPRLGERQGRRWNFFFPLRTWALAGGVAALLLAAFWGGRLWQQRQTPTVAAIPAPARQRILMVALGDHLERAQMLLVEVMNQEAAGPVDVSATRQLAQDLVQSNRLYRQTALREGEPGMATVLDELERMLLQISHGPNQISSDELESLKRQIESQGILFKVRVIELQVQEKEKKAGPPTTGTALRKQV